MECIFRVLIVTFVLYTCSRSVHGVSKLYPLDESQRTILSDLLHQINDSTLSHSDFNSYFESTSLNLTHVKYGDCEHASLDDPDVVTIDRECLLERVSDI